MAKIADSLDLLAAEATGGGDAVLEAVVPKRKRMTRPETRALREQKKRADAEHVSNTLPTDWRGRLI